MGTVNSSEPQARVSADVDPDEGVVGLVDADGEPIEQVPPKPIAALAVDAGLEPGEPVAIVTGPIASAPEGFIPEDQAKMIADAVKEATKASKGSAQASKKELEAQAKALGIASASKMKKDKLAAAVQEAEAKAATEGGEEKMPGDDPSSGDDGGDS